MKVTKITLEDKGQDVLMLFVDSNGVVSLCMGWCSSSHRCGWNGKGGCGMPDT